MLLDGRLHRHQAQCTQTRVDLPGREMGLPMEGACTAGLVAALAAVRMGVQRGDHAQSGGERESSSQRAVLLHGAWQRIGLVLAPSKPHATDLVLLPHDTAFCKPLLSPASSPDSHGQGGVAVGGRADQGHLGKHPGNPGLAQGKRRRRRCGAAAAWCLLALLQPPSAPSPPPWMLECLPGAAAARGCCGSICPAAPARPPAPPDSTATLVVHVPISAQDGIQFQDVTTILLDPVAFKHTIDLLVERYQGQKVDVIAGEPPWQSGTCGCVPVASSWPACCSTRPACCAWLCSCSRVHAGF